MHMLVRLITRSREILNVTRCGLNGFYTSGAVTWDILLENMMVTKVIMLS